MTKSAPKLEPAAYARAQRALRQVIREHPELCAEGLIQPRHSAEWRRWWQIDRTTERRELAREVKEFAMACDWLSRQPRRKTVNRGMSSHGLKHVVEGESRCYLTNGAFIAAALALGFTVRPMHRGSLNAYLNIATAAFDGKPPARRASVTRTWPSESGT